jgi:hypothetical protein
MGIKKSPGQTRPGGGGPRWVPYLVTPHARQYFFSFFQAGPDRPPEGPVKGVSDRVEIVLMARIRFRSFSAVGSIKSIRYASLSRTAKDPRGPSGLRESFTIRLSGLNAFRMHSARASSIQAAATKAVPRSPCFVNRTKAFRSESESGGNLCFFATGIRAYAYYFCYCRVERKRGTIRRTKHCLQRA